MQSSVIPDITREIFTNVQTVAFDTVIVATIFLLFLVYALMAGKGRILSLMYSFYIASILFIFFPFFDMIPESLGYSRAIIEFGVYGLLLLFTTLATMNAVRVEFCSGSIKRLLMATVFSLTATLFALTIVWRVLPNISDIHQFGSPIGHLLDPTNNHTWWILAMPVLLSLTVRSRRGSE